MFHNYEIGGGLGNSVAWDDVNKFGKPFTEKTKFSVHGFQRFRPKVGDILKGEFEKSTMWFRFISVKLYTDPSDMFHAEVVPMHQEPKKILSQKPERHPIHGACTQL